MKLHFGHLFHLGHYHWPHDGGIGNAGDAVQYFWHADTHCGFFAFGHGGGAWPVIVLCGVAAVVCLAVVFSSRDSK
jgi:hypothetical protein